MSGLKRWGNSSIFVNTELNDTTKKYNGSVGKFIAWKSKIKLYSGSLLYGDILLSPSFVPTIIPDDLTSRISVLEASTNAFQPLTDGTDEQKEAHERKHDRNVNELTLKYKNLENARKKMHDLVISATKIIIHAGESTEGIAKTSIDTIINNAAMNVQEKPSKIISICRINHYPPGSATTAADVIRNETDRLPRALTIEDIRENMEAITRANTCIANIVTDLDSHYIPQLEELDKQMAGKNQAITLLRQPPPDLPDGQVFQVNEFQIANLQRDIQEAQYVRQSLLMMRSRDQINPLVGRTLAMNFLISMPSDSNDFKINAIRTKVDNIINEDTMHHWPVYEAEITKALRTQDAMNAFSGSSTSLLPSHERAYAAQGSSDNQESTMLARGEYPCYQHLVDQCRDRNCSFSHAGQEGSRKEFKGLLVKTNRLENDIKGYKSKIADLLHTIKDRDDGINNSQARSQSPHGRGRSNSPSRNEPYSKQGGKGLAGRSRTSSPGRDGNDRSRSRYDNYGQRPSTPGPN